MEILGQVFEMDELDDEDEDGEGGGHEFSKGIVENYFEQANTTFDEMKEALYVYFPGECDCLALTM